jgi:hypothetical protein
MGEVAAVAGVQSEKTLTEATATKGFEGITLSL